MSQQTYDPTMGRRLLDDGRELTLVRMLYGNTRLCAGDPGSGGYADGWCFHKTDLALKALEEWDGQGHPYGYYRHLGSDHRQDEFA